MQKRHLILVLIVSASAAALSGCGGYEVVGNAFDGETESQTEGSSETESMAFQPDTESETEPNGYTEGAGHKKQPYSYIFEELGDRPEYSAGKYVRACNIDDITIKPPVPQSASEDETDEKVREFFLKNDCTEDVSDGEIEDGDKVEATLGKKKTISFVINTEDDDLITREAKESLLRKEKGYSEKVILKNGEKETLVVKAIFRAKPLTDSTAKECSHGSYKTKEEFENYIKNIIKAEKYEKEREKYVDALSEEIIEKSAVLHFPADVLKYDNGIEILKAKEDAKRKGKSFEAYVKTLGYNSANDFYKGKDEEIKDSLSKELILSAMAEKLGVMPDDTEFSALSSAYADSLGYSSASACAQDIGEGKIRVEIVKEKIAEKMLEK